MNGIEHEMKGKRRIEIIDEFKQKTLRRQGSIKKDKYIKIKLGRQDM